MKTYERFSTTADIGIRVFGKTFKDLFINSLKAFNSLVFNENKIKDKNLIKTLSYSTSGDSYENLLHKLLDEIFYHTYNNFYYIDDLKLNKLKPDFISTDFNIYKINQKPEIDIKSITYHNFKIIEKGGTKYIEIVFDI